MESMGNHLQRKHEIELLDISLSTAMSWYAVQKMGITQCPLCSSRAPEDSPDLVDHILWHAYDFALRALPWPYPESHDLNVPPGNFNLPEDTIRAADLVSWIGKTIHESTEDPQLQTSKYDTADHRPLVSVDMSEYTDYFLKNPYFTDSPDNRSSRPEGNQSVSSTHSNATPEELV